MGRCIDARKGPRRGVVGSVVWSVVIHLTRRHQLCEPELLRLRRRELSRAQQAVDPREGGLVPAQSRRLVRAVCRPENRCWACGTPAPTAVVRVAMEENPKLSEIQPPGTAVDLLPENPRYNFRAGALEKMPQTARRRALAPR